jgi:plastocyanin
MHSVRVLQLAQSRDAGPSTWTVGSFRHLQ